MFFTLQMQVTMANKPGWMLGGYEAVGTITWAETRLPRVSPHFRRASPVASQRDSEALSVTVLWAIPFTHLQRGIFQATSHWAPWFSNGNGTFWEPWGLPFQPGVWAHPPKNNGKEPCSLSNMKGKILNGLFLLIADPKLEFNKKGAPISSRRSGKGLTLLILEPQHTFIVVPTGLRDLEAGFSNWGMAVMVLPRPLALQTKVFIFHCETALISYLLSVWAPCEWWTADNNGRS